MPASRRRVVKKGLFVDASGETPAGYWEPGRRRRGSLPSVLIALASFALLMMSVYVLFRGMAFLNPGYSLADRVFAVLLLGAECFLFVHTTGYLLSVVRSGRSYRTTDENLFVSINHPTTAVVVASYNEDPAILEETLASMANLDYPAKCLYLLDDSTDESLRQRIEALAAIYNCRYVHRRNRRGYKAGAINDLLKDLPEKYLAVFDADQKPVPNFLGQTIALLEDDPKLAFVQTPQYYHNTEGNAVAYGAAYQQVVFYEYICEGKSVSNAMFSCGSNVVYRVEALRSVGCFDERSVTEDFATGLKLHLNGWKSLYYNFVYVFGLGPESLSAYFTQQMRWAMGTLGLFNKMVGTLLRRPGSLKLGQWWEYGLSGSYYWVGWVNFVLVLCPIAFLVFDVRPLIADPLVYAAAFLPYLVFAMSNFYYSMWRRGTKPKSLLVGQSLTFSTFWVQMNAAIMALFGVKRPFGVTPKGVVTSLKLKYLLPHIILIAASLAAVAVGVYKAFSGYGAAIIINVLWAAYHVVMLSMVFYFNKPHQTYEPKPVYIRATPAPD